MKDYGCQILSVCVIWFDLQTLLKVTDLHNFGRHLFHIGDTMEPRLHFSIDAPVSKTERLIA